MIEVMIADDNIFLSRQMANILAKEKSIKDFISYAIDFINEQ